MHRASSSHRYCCSILCTHQTAALCLVHYACNTLVIYVQISPGDELLNPLDSVNPDPLFSPTTSITTISKDAAAAVAAVATDSNSQTTAAAAAAAGSGSDSDDSASAAQQQSSQPWGVVNSAATAAAVGTA
jgi:hypothetical protein